jgi:hypothetical protein
MVTWAWLRSSHGWHKFQQSCAGTLSPPPSPAAGAWPCLCLPLHLDLPPPLFSHWVSTSTAGGDLGREGQGRQEWVHPTLPYFPHSPARPKHTPHTPHAHCPLPTSTVNLGPHSWRCLQESYCQSCPILPAPHPPVPPSPGLEEEHNPPCPSLDISSKSTLNTISLPQP